MKIDILDSESAAKMYSHLCLPAYRYLLTDTTALSTRVLAIGYRVFGQPVGLLLGEYYPHRDCVCLCSIFVRSQYRRCGIGSELLAALTQLAKQRAYRALEIDYPGQTASTPVLSALLAKAAWSAPKPLKIACKCDGEALVAALRQAPWMTRYQLPDEFFLFPWKTLAPSEFQHLAEQHAARADEPDLTPQIDRFAEVNSLGLRYKDKVVGWMLTKSLGGTRILYENLFIQPEFRNLGRAAVLLSASIKQHCQRDANAACGIWQTQLSNKPMVAFIKRRLGPYVSEWQETLSCGLSLTTQLDNPLSQDINELTGDLCSD